MMQELMKDPAAMKQLQEAFANVLKDPKQREAFEEQQRQMASALEKLSLDPALKQFFQDIQKDGLGAMKKYENDGGLLKKLTAAMGGLPGMPGLPGAPAAGGAFEPGDEVVIDGLSQAPELNGRRATVVSRVAGDEVGADGAARVVVKPENLRPAAQAEAARMLEQAAGEAAGGPAGPAGAPKLELFRKLEDLQRDPELRPVFEDIRQNGMAAVEKYWEDKELMARIQKAMGFPR